MDGIALLDAGRRRLLTTLVGNGLAQALAMAGSAWCAQQVFDQWILGASGAGERRLFVLSDGKWQDVDAASLSSNLRELDAAGIRRAALFLGDEVPGEARALFARSVDASSERELAEALLRLEREAEQRVRDAHDREIDLGGPGSARRASEAMVTRSKPISMRLRAYSGVML